MAKLRNVGFILIAVLFLALSWGCTSDALGGSASTPLENVEDNVPGTFEGLSAELEMRILQDLFDMPTEESRFDEDLVKSIRISRYCGTYDGWVTVVITNPFPRPHVSRILNIGGVKFPYSLPVIVWKEGTIHGIQAAYDLGLLKQSDLENISKMLKKEDEE